MGGAAVEGFLVVGEFGGFDVAGVGFQPPGLFFAGGRPATLLAFLGVVDDVFFVGKGELEEALDLFRVILVSIYPTFSRILAAWHGGELT